MPIRSVRLLSRTLVDRRVEASCRQNSKYAVVRHLVARGLERTLEKVDRLYFWGPSQPNPVELDLFRSS